MKRIGCFLILFLLYSCATTHTDSSTNKHPHMSDQLNDSEASKSQLDLITENDPKLGCEIESDTEAVLNAQQNEWDALDLVWPTSGTLTSKYGMRKLRKRTRMHKGIDIGARTGTPVYAAETGRVKFNGKMRGYGTAIILKHDSVHDTLYAHLSRVNVKSNQVVHKNQLIGYVGRTGYTTGANLHFEMRINGYAQDPLTFLPRSEDQKKVRVGEVIIVKNRHIATKSTLKTNSKS